MICPTLWRTVSAEWVSPFAPASAVVKKNLSSKIPRGVAMDLLEVTRLIVLSCKFHLSRDIAQGERPQLRDAMFEKPVLAPHDLG